MYEPYFIHSNMLRFQKLFAQGSGLTKMQLGPEHGFIRYPKAFPSTLL